MTGQVQGPDAVDGTAADDTYHVSNPHAVPAGMPVAEMLQHWSDARARVFTAHHTPGGLVDPADLFTELALSARIAVEVQSGRWCAVAELLRAGAVSAWAEVGTALDITETEAHDGFHAWINGQVDLRRRTGTIGLTDADAEQLHALAEAVIL